MIFRVLAGPEHGPYPLVVNAETGEAIPYRSLSINVAVGKPIMLNIEVFAELDLNTIAGPIAKGKADE